eukprot:6831919-Karenia_brevis.AAC.1
MWDWFAAKHLERWTKAALQEFPGCYWGSGEGAQVTDITSTNALIVAKGLAKSKFNRASRCGAIR